MSSAPRPLGNSKKTRVLAYVDGFNLYYGLKNALREADEEHVKNGGDPSECLGRSLYWLDIHAMVQGQIRGAEECVGIRYFSAPRKIPKLLKPDQVERARLVASNARQSQYLEALRTLPLTKVVLGYYSEKNPHRCEICHHRHAVWEEKGTDVNMATEIVCDAHADRYDTALVMTADNDLAEPIRASIRFGKKVRLVMTPGRKRAKHLEAAASETVNLPIKMIRGLRLPDSVVKAKSGSTIQCPVEWCQHPGWVWEEPFAHTGWRHSLIRWLAGNGKKQSDRISD